MVSSFKLETEDDSKEKQTVKFARALASHTGQEYNVFFSLVKLTKLRSLLFFSSQ